MSQGKAVNVRGTTTPVFGTQRPNDLFDVLIDVANFTREFFGTTAASAVSNLAADTSWTMPEILDPDTSEPVPLEDDSRWMVSITIYMGLAGDFTVVSTDWSDAASSAVYVVPTFGDGKQSSTGARGQIFVYNAIFDYNAGSIAAPKFSFQLHSTASGYFETYMSVIRGIAGNTGTDLSPT